MFTYLLTPDEAQGNKQQFVNLSYEGYQGYVYPNGKQPEGCISVKEYYDKTTQQYLYDGDRGIGAYRQRGVVWWMLSAPAANTAPLYQFSRHNSYFCSTDKNAEGKLKSGYTLQKTLGYIYLISQPGTQKLRRYYSGPDPVVISPDAYIPAAPKSLEPGQANFTGLLRQPADDGDIPFVRNPSQRAKIETDLTPDFHTPKLPFDQGKHYSCVANAVAAALIFGSNAEHFRSLQNNEFAPSRLWLWWIARFVQAVGEQVAPKEVENFLKWQQGREGKDDDLVTGVSAKHQIAFKNIDIFMSKERGCCSRDMLHAVQRLGVLPESFWEYSESPSSLSTPPKSVDNMSIAARYANPDFSFFRITDLEMDQTSDPLGDIESALAEGFPVILAMQYPDAADRTLSGQNLDDDFLYPYLCSSADGKAWSSHAVLAVGYHKTKRRLKILNSWGSSFGQNGYFYIPYDRFEATEGKGYWRNDAGSKIGQVTDIWVAKVPPGWRMPQAVRVMSPDADWSYRPVTGPYDMGKPTVTTISM